jgi:hypothetical protein
MSSQQALGKLFETDDPYSCVFRKRDHPPYTDRRPHTPADCRFERVYIDSQWGIWLRLDSDNSPLMLQDTSVQNVIFSSTGKESKQPH